MSKILVIPDTHLKPKIFNLADKIMRENKVDYAIQLGDNIDDFYCYDDQYRNHSARMLQFFQDHPNTIWLWGNHEISYLINRPVTGNLYCGKQYAHLYKENFHPKFVHLDGKIVFSHAGIFQEFINANNLENCKNTNELISKINELDYIAFWQDNSPIWARPQYTKLTKNKELSNYTQVVGHTPIKNIVKHDGIISVDTFSTNWSQKFGSEQMIIIDTENLSFKIIDIDFRKEFGDSR